MALNPATERYDDGRVLDNDGREVVVVQAIDITTIPLPAGASTSAKQDVQHSDLADIAETLGDVSTKAKQDVASALLTDILAAVEELDGNTDGIEALLGTLATQATLAALNAKFAALDADGNVPVTVSNALVPREADNLTLAYTDEDLTSVVYKQGITTVATLALSYTDGQLVGVSRS